MEDREREVAAATAYESLFVPALFHRWAVLLADAAHLTPGERVLDVACGTGIAAREALRRVGARGAVAGIDPARGMLAVANRVAEGVDFQLGSAESLPWPDGSFDVVVSQFGLMFFTDRTRAVREMMRVLAPGGRLALAVWASLSETPAFAAEVEIVQRVAGTRAADALRAPFAMGDPAELTALLVGAGASGIDLATVRAPAEFPSVRSLVEADVRGWLPLMGVALPEARIAEVLRAAEAALRAHVTEDGKFRFEAAAHLVTATRPANAPGAPSTA